MTDPPNYNLNIAIPLTLIFHNNLDTSEKSGCCLQPDIPFPYNYNSSDEIKSLPEPLDRLRNVRPLSPVVSLENATRKERNLNHDKNSNIQKVPAQISFNGTLEASDEETESIRKHSITLMLVDDDRETSCLLLNQYGLQKGLKWKHSQVQMKH